MDASLDQFRVFAEVVQAGSFSAAARKLGRAQSAITYAIQRLEAGVGVALFDRSGYRPVLTEAGRMLLSRAVRVLEEVDAFSVQAQSLAGGLEADVGLVVDPMFPPRPLVAVLGRFQAEFPSVDARLRIEALGAGVRVLLDGDADLGVVTAFVSDTPGLVRVPLGDVELVSVAAPGHPLARRPGPLPPEILREHVQLVLTDRSEITAGREYGVVASRSWRIADLGAKHAMLRAGLGWGSIPRHMVDADLEAGRLVLLQPAEWDGATELPRLAMVLAHRADHALGPAGRWMLQAIRDELAPRQAS